MSVSPYQQHVAQWRDCHLCELCHGRKQVVFARGCVPCDVLFVGEAPGESEDVLGSPFVGPAGALLDKIVDRALTGVTLPTGFGAAFYNLVGCFPREAKTSGDHEPPEAAIKACSPRLQEFVAIARPRIIVCVGKLAETYLEQGYKHSVKLPRVLQTTGVPVEIKQASITHPAAILRAPVAARELMVKRCVVTISNSVDALHASR